jgi:DNA-binding NarL/FixJ family response regulator
MTRVLIADDHTIFRQGLAELLAAEETIQVSGTASDGRETISAVKSILPDVLILDLSMPHLDGFEVVRRLRAERLPVKIIILTMHKDPATIQRASELEVDGYVLKEEAFDDLAYAIRTVASGRTFFSPSVVASASRGGPADASPLSPRERQVVGCIARGLTTKEIADQLGISVKTVETHRQRIMEKLDCHKATELVLYAVKAGLAP